MATRRVFISYARKDGTDAAHALCDALRGAGCAVWLDTERIHGGASWSKEIEAALNGCEVLVAVLTPASYVSEICRAEQIWALDEGKIVIPVLAVTGAPVPIHLKSRNWRRYPQQQAELIADIAAEPATEAPMSRPLRYDTVPNLPQNHIVREKPLAELRDLVFTEGAGANIAVTALAGMGGIGKTVLATMLCRDAVVQRAFPDGIAWITIGRKWDGDFVTRMREVARALGDDLSGYDNPLACENRYRTILREKAALVVVDDVWNLEHLKPLLVDAPRSRFLFTTRDFGIAKAVTDRKYSANLLSGSEARDLLARWSGKAKDALPPEAERIIRACGELALAVAQVGACLLDSSLDEWRDALQGLESADISAIEERLPSGQRSFFKSLAVSFQALPAQMQEQYLNLAVLLEDVPAPLVVLQTLWRVNAARARQIARYFVDRSLASWEATAEPARGIRLHDLQLDYVRACFSDQAALQLIHGALRLSANVIAQRPEEFASQMMGRLLPYDGMEAIAEFRSEVANGGPRPFFRPLWPTLHPPGTGLIQTLVGHSGSVYGVALTADGQRAISASGDETLKIWDIDSGRELHTLAGHSDAIYAVTITADGRYAISASGDHTLKVWDLARGQELRTLAGHSLGVSSVAVTADGKRAISASSDHTLRIWDLDSGKTVRKLTGHSDAVWGVAVTADGQRAISASADKTLKVWDLARGRQLQTLAGHSDWITHVAVTEDGKRAISASGDTTLKVWDLDSGRELRTLVGHLNGVNSVTLTSDGKRVVSGSKDKMLKVWDLDTGRQLRTLAGHSNWINDVVVTRDGTRAVSACYDGTLKVWDMASSSEARKPPGHTYSVTDVAVTKDGRRAVSVSFDGTLKVWDLPSGREVRTLGPSSSPAYGVAVTADGRRAVCACYGRILKVLDLANGTQLRAMKGHSASVWDVTLTTDGKQAISASEDHTLKVWDLTSGRQLRTLVGHSGIVYEVAATENGRCVISASDDCTLKVWDAVRGRELRTLTGHGGGVTGIAVTTDGRRAVSASKDRTLKLWDVDTGQELRTLARQSQGINGVTITADGDYVIFTSEDAVKVWDVTTGEVTARFTCEDTADHCVFAGANQILVADRSGRLYFLRLEI